MPPTDDSRERNERLKALDAAVGQIEKQFGKGSIMRLGQHNAVAPMEAISTGAISIDSGYLRLIGTNSLRIVSFGA